MLAILALYGIALGVAGFVEYGRLGLSWRWSFQRCLPPLVLACLFLSATRLPTLIAMRCGLISLSTLITLLIGDLLIANSQRANLVSPEDARRAYCHAHGLPYDERTVLEVVRKMRADGAAAVPVVCGAEFYSKGRSLSLASGPAIPLAGISDATTVYANELGSYLIYRSDEHGFHNPRGLHRPGNTEVVAIGDSFTLGACVPSDANAVALIRAIHPDTVNLGMGGNGPLSELATLREYGLPLRPKTVLWFFYEGNDLTDIPIELASPLQSYLQPGYVKGLASFQHELDGQLTTYIESGLSEHTNSANSSPSLPALRLLDVCRGVHLVSSLSQLLRKPASNIPESTFGSLTRILTLARDETAGIGARLIIVYLPEYARYSSLRFHRQDGERVRAIVASLGLPLVDIVPAFDRHPRPLTLYPFSLYGHYTPEGYGLVAHEVLKSLTVDH